MKVKDPSGQTWRVHRRWVPWNPKARKLKPDRDLTSILDGIDGVDDLAGLALALVLGLLFVLLAPILILVMLTGVEFILILAVLPFAIVGRMFFGKRWWVQVRRGRTLEREEMVGDWAASGQAVRDIAKAISVETPSVVATPGS
ncbi:hypothetical protein [Nocardioides sp.]|uniref:hypothetical protein n=1 Tax=Nocardioides sp. TaxID=35761 RepID=UPI0026029972|nr:hypothetical protein [Nocardioides sp.]